MKYCLSRFYAGIALLLLLTIPAQAGEYVRETLVKPAHLHILNGLVFDRDDNLYVGSVIGQSVYKVNVANHSYETLIGPTDGMADDIETDASGALYWTSIMTGEIFKLDKGSTTPKVIASGHPGFNSIAFNAQGRLFSGLVFLGDALYEIDPQGIRQPKLVIDKPGGLNRFDFGADGKIYGPLWFKKQIVSIDIDTKEIKVIADGFGIPSAANFNSRGELFVTDTQEGQVIRVNTKTGEKTVIVDLTAGIDNLAFDSKDNLFISRPSDNAILRVDVAKGTTEEIIRGGGLSVSADISLIRDPNGEKIFVADVLSLREINTETGEMREIARMRTDKIENPMYIDVSARYLAVSSWQTNLVQVFDRKTRQMILSSPAVKMPHDVLVMGDNVLVASQSDKSLWRLSLPGGKAELVCKCLESAGSLTAKDDDIYIAETLAGKISHFSLVTNKRDVIAQGLDSPQGIDVMTDGRLVFAEVGTKRLIALDSTNGKQQVLATAIPVGLPAVKGRPEYFMPTGVTASSDGTIYLSSNTDTAVYKYSAP